MKRKRKSLPPYDVADLPFDVVSDYLDVMAKSAKNKKAKKHYTEQLLLQIKRPANLWPSCTPALPAGAQRSLWHHWCFCFRPVFEKPSRGQVASDAPFT